MSIARQGAATNLYRIEDEIGAGGMGNVYRAEDVQLKRRVAMKVLRSTDPDLMERFLREQEITAELDHPGFVRVLGIGYMDDAEGSHPFYTMPLIRGLTLEQLVVRRRRRDGEGDRLRSEFTLTRLLQIMQQICLTLQSAHDKRILHRDLKPPNIIVGPYGEVYVMDLGLAKHLGPKSKETVRFSVHVMQQLAKVQEFDLTQGAILGTPYYMAPEQSLNPRQVDHRADVFGLGGILYFILTGRKPQYVEPPLDREDLEHRKADLYEKLKPFVPPGKGFAGLLMAREDDLPAAAQPLLDDYREVVGLMSGSDYFKLRITMKECVIIPPAEAAKRRGGEDMGDTIDTALEAICMKALAKKPEARYASCRAMWKELQQYVEGRHELILKRKGQELASDNSRTNAPLALEHYEQAERRLQEAISQREVVGQMGIEDRLELFDILVGKARLYDQRGDNEAIVLTMTKAEPLIESTLAVLERQFIQVLLCKAIARYKQGHWEDAKALGRRAMELSEARAHPDLRLKAAYYYGLSCLRAYDAGGEADDFDHGEQALGVARHIADEFGDLAAAARARVALARLTIERQGGEAVAKCLLEEAAALAGSDPLALSEVHAALSGYWLRQGDAAASLTEAEESVRLAQVAESPAALQEALFALAQAHHRAGDPAKRAATFKEILFSKGPPNGSVVAEAVRFYAKNNLDPAELGIETAPEGALAAKAPT